MEAVREFFQKQTFEQASAGDISYRSAFNALVADLNEGFQENGVPIKYVQKDNNEMETGLLNLTRVLSRILGIKIQEDQTDLSNFENWVYLKKQWVQKNLEEILNKSTKEKKHIVKIEEVIFWEQLQDLTGRIHVTVHDLSHNLLYSYNIVSGRTHIAIKGLNSHRQKSEILSTHAAPDLNGSSQDSIWTLLPEYDQFKKIPFLYQLFSNPIVDNHSRIDFVKRIVEHFNDEVVKMNIVTLKRMLKNVFHQFSWNDDVVVELISPYLLNLLRKDPDFFKDLGNEIKSLRIGYIGDLGTSIINSGLRPEKLTLAINHKGKTYSLEFLKEVMGYVKVLNLGTSKLEGLVGFEYAPNLEVLDLSNNHPLRTLDISGAKNLKKLDLGYLDIVHLSGFDQATRLEELNLDQAEKLKTLTLTGAQNLRKLSMHASEIEKLDGLEDLERLESLNLASTEKLQKLNLKGLKSLKTLNLNKSNLISLEGLSHMQKLEELDLEETKELKSLVVGGSHLKKLKLKKSGVTNLTISTDVESLEEVDLEISQVKTITGLQHASNLKNLRLQGTKLTQLDVTGLGSLEYLWLQNSGIKTLSGLRDAKNLKKLYIYGTRNLKYLYLEDVTQPLEIDADFLRTIYAGNSLLDNIVLNGGDEDITVKYVGKKPPKINFKSTGSGRLLFEEIEQ